MSLRKPDLPTIRRTSLSVLTLMLALLTVAAMPPARAQGGDAIVVQAREALRTKNGPALASARQILASLGKPTASAIAVAEAADTAKIFSANPLNGDGVIPPDSIAMSGHLLPLFLVVGEKD